MIDVIAIHMEENGSGHLQHIAELKWVATSAVGQHGNPADAKKFTRADMYKFVKEYPGRAYAISRNDNTYALLEAVDNGNVKYVKTQPDSTTADNLLSLPRY